MENIIEENLTSKEAMSAKTVTHNACRMCSPLGATFVFKGIEGGMCLLHGSQGCSTYIRRYMISHFREPIDIASSNFTEESAVFGGKSNLKQAIANVTRQYSPKLIGIATTCLAETIGDDVPSIAREYLEEAEKEKAASANGENSYIPAVVTVSTPSYAQSHCQGFLATTTAVVKQLTEKYEREMGHDVKEFIDVKDSRNEKNKNQPSEEKEVALLSGMVSPEDIRHYKELLEDFGLTYTLFPDYSDTLDGGLTGEYVMVAPGGTTVSEIERLGRARNVIEFGLMTANNESPGKYLKETHNRPLATFNFSIGVGACDPFIKRLKEISGKPTPVKIQKERARLLDSYADAHKKVYGKKVVLYGEEDFVLGLLGFVIEIGMIPVLVATGSTRKSLQSVITNNFPIDIVSQTVVMEDTDFDAVERKAVELAPDIIIGNSKGYKMARRLDVPLVRLGFPIHDRYGGQRLLHVGYRGAQRIFDQLVNALLEKAQRDNPTGWFYL